MRKKGFFLTNRHVSWAVSFFIISSFFIFISGYFLGKKKAVEKFYNKIDQESLADNIYYSVCSIYDTDKSVEQKSTEDSSNEIISEQVKLVCDNTIKKVDTKAQHAIKKMVKEPLGGEITLPKDNKTTQESFYAELIGFGTLRAANNFAQKLKKQGFSVVVKRRVSRTPKKRRITWYQVITEKFDNKSDLIAFVDIIKDKEKLKGVRIVQC